MQQRRLSNPVEVVDNPDFVVGSGKMVCNEVLNGVTGDMFTKCLSVSQLVLDCALNSSD